jgi:hypothetical protein
VVEVGEGVVIEHQTWMPIETAPKSTSTQEANGARVRGIYLLGFMPDDTSSDPATGISVIWWEPHGGHRKQGHWVSDAGIDGCKPSHWMALPAPPDA